MAPASTARFSAGAQKRTQLTWSGPTLGLSELSASPEGYHGPAIPLELSRAGRRVLPSGRTILRSGTQAQRGIEKRPAPLRATYPQSRDPKIEEEHQEKDERRCSRECESTAPLHRQLHPKVEPEGVRDGPRRKGEEEAPTNHSNKPLGLTPARDRVTRLLYRGLG